MMGKEDGHHHDEAEQQLLEAQGRFIDCQQRLRDLIGQADSPEVSAS